MAALAAICQYIAKRPQAAQTTPDVGLSPDTDNLASCLIDVVGEQAVLLPLDEGFAAAALSDNR